ncbi:hypothetical protein [Streptomyces erythrochromogenes]|uniref:hypothetical protein n=1 Tax=Streptomyces erythrochromogenes TaxID=285574 RepID=UPI00386CBAF0|nr:hypothetical protein OG364_29550 [Streptomyces erythrochromogenes]
MSRADVTATGLHAGFSDDDRAAYEELLCDAGYDEWGQQYPAYEIKERVHFRLTAAAEAGEEWAVHVLERDARDGHLRAFRTWDRSLHVVSTRQGDRIVKRAAVVSTRRRDPHGQIYHQGTFIEAMTRAEVEAELTDVWVSAQTVQDRFSTWDRLRMLLDRTGRDVVGEALADVGMTLDEYLMSAPEAAS